MQRLLLLAILTHALNAAGTTVLFDPSTPQTGPFPSDYLTVADHRQFTGLRVSLPVPDCGSQPTACLETKLLDQYDGFSLRARAQARFSGPVNTATLRGGIFFVALENLTQDEPGIHKPGELISINQVVYDPSTNTVYAKPDSVLDQHRRYAVVITDIVTDAAGTAVNADAAYQACAQGGSAYCVSLARELTALAAAVAPRKIVAASVFTTMSATQWLERAREILETIPPMATLVQPQSAFSIPDLATFTLHEQTGTNPAQFFDFSLPLDPTLLNGLGSLVIGSFWSPNFLDDDQTIAPLPPLRPRTLAVDFARPGFAETGLDALGRQPRHRMSQVYFNALLPAAPPPAAGYPVVIFGHGFGDSRFGGPTAIAPVLARAGFATIAINAVGHGFGPLSTFTLVDKTGRGTTLTAGGRSVDLNGDGVIEANEGCALMAPVALGTRDCFRQTVVDLIQLVRVIQQGLDLTGDGKSDLDPARIYYAGESLGAIYGTMLTALEPAVRAAALNVGGATTVDIARWSPAYRSLATAALALRMPPLLNQGTAYNEDYVLPDQPVKVTTVAGAVPIQNVFETLEWLGMTGDAMAFAPHLKLSPLPGTAARPVLIQFARGDQTVPNPANTGLIRAAGLQASTWEYRHDLARAKAPDLPANPHPYLVLFISLGPNGVQLPGVAGLAVSIDAQNQIAGFFTSGGATIPDPNALVKLLLGITLFEIPSVLPQDLGF